MDEKQEQHKRKQAIRLCLKRIKTFRYPWAEAVASLRSGFKQRAYRRKILTMS